jgi:hypothetical protein
VAARTVPDGEVRSTHVRLLVDSWGQGEDAAARIVADADSRAKQMGD